MRTIENNEPNQTIFQQLFHSSINLLIIKLFSLAFRMQFSSNQKSNFQFYSNQTVSMINFVSCELIF